MAVGVQARTRSRASLSLWLEDGGGREHLEPLHGARRVAAPASRRRRSSRADGGICRIGLESPAAAVRQGPRRLQEDQAFLRLVRFNAASVGLAREDEVIGDRIVTRGARASGRPCRRAPRGRPGIAAGPGQDRLDVVAETPSKWLFGVRNCNCRNCDPVVDRGRDGRRAIASGADDAIGVHGADSGIGRSERGVGVRSAVARSASVSRTSSRW